MALVQSELQKCYIGNSSVRLPSAYQEVEYIESSGTQWIDTLITPNSNTKIQTKLSCTNNNGFVSVGYYGGIDTQDRRLFLTNQRKWAVDIPGGSGVGNRIIGWDGTYGTVEEIEFGNFYIKNLVNSQTYTGTAGTFTGTSTIKLSRDEGLNLNDSNVFYYVKIREGNTLVRDFVPCYRKLDNVIGMYDVVNNTFYTNSGSGTFTKGADVNVPYTEIKKIMKGTTQIRPASQPVTTTGIYWSSDLGVITFQTSNGVGISIADKNLGATQVYNSGDAYSFANMGYGYQWGNNYGWEYGTNPQTTSTTSVNASSYGPGNYYSSDTFIKITNDNYGWDSSNNANLWGGTTDTYAARQGPCDEGRHIPSKADAQTLVNAISSITGSVNVSKINQYCKLPSVLPGIERGTVQWSNEPRGGIRYSDTYNNQSGGMLYLPTSGSYVVNENSRKAEALPLRPFSNTFIQPTDSWTRLDNS